MTHPLLELGIHRIACPVPFREAGGPVNVYVVEEPDGGVALFDAGLGTPEGETAVREGFARLGLSFGDVRRIFLSHGHIDHYGLARTISEESGAPVHVHALDRDKVERPLARWNEAREVYRDYLLRMGVDEEAFARIERVHHAHLQMARPLERTRPLEAGERLQFKHFAATVEHCPGHTPGLTCLWVPEHRLLFADDHLLERVSPNPLLELGPEGEAGKFRALSTYLRTLQRTRALGAELVLPGHNEPFRGPERIIDSLLAFYERRQAKILERLAQGPATAVELVAHLFPRAAHAELFLTLSEAVGNLELLEERGLVERLPARPLHRWALAEASPAAAPARAG